MTIPAKMRAVLIRNDKGTADALYVGKAETPLPKAGEILIKTVSAGVNRPDIGQREGNYPPPPGASPILGLEVAGTVVALGDNVTNWRIGDRVAALLPGGGYAEYANVDGRHALPVPESLALEDAGALPETIFTVFTNVFERGRLAAGETLLIHGGNSGIGVTAILLAKAAGAKVFTTVRGATKVAQAKAAGADLVIDSLVDDFAPIVVEAGGADVILDIVGGDYFSRNVTALKVEGRLVQIATLGGNLVQADLLQLMFKRLTVTASTLRGRDADEKARMTAAIAAKVWPWIMDGTVRLPVERRFSLDQAGEAHRWLESGSQFGKVVLNP